MPTALPPIALLPTALRRAAPLLVAVALAGCQLEPPLVPGPRVIEGRTYVALEVLDVGLLGQQLDHLRLREPEDDAKGAVAGGGSVAVPAGDSTLFRWQAATADYATRYNQARLALAPLGR
jgi:hypothetical protein